MDIADLKPAKQKERILEILNALLQHVEACDEDRDEERLEDLAEIFDDFMEQWDVDDRFGTEGLLREY